MKVIIKLDKENIERVYEIYTWKTDINGLQFVLSEKDSKDGISGVVTIIMEGNDRDLLRRLICGPRKMGFYGELDRLLEEDED